LRLSKYLKSFIKISPYCSGPSPSQEINELMAQAPALKAWTRFYLKESLEYLLQNQKLPLHELQLRGHCEFAQHRGHRFSLSHNPELIALWLWQVDQIAAGGIDIEWGHRPHSPRLASYISHPKDKISSLTALEFFCAKEAAFKCLHNLDSIKMKPKSLNEINICDQKFFFLDIVGSMKIKKVPWGERQLIIAMAEVAR
jgi:hypothetical protein